MANKLYIDNTDHDVAYEPSESEDEYSEEEKEILKEIRQRNKKKPESKKEVLAFDDDSDAQEADGGEDDDDDEDDDIIGDSDIERGDEDDGIPDSKAWGKQRRSYYNTDFVDQDYSAYNEQEEEQAQQEEEEAKSIQLRLAKQLDEADFFLDLPAGATASDEDENEKSKKAEEEEKIKIKLKTDLSGLSVREKQQLFKKDSPEFAGLVNDFQVQLLEGQNLLNPVMEFARERKLNLPIFQFVETRNNLILTYCNNVAAYLLLKAKRIPIKYHPVTKRLAQLKKLLIQLQEKYETVVRPQLEVLLEKIKSGEEIEILEEPVEKKPTKKLRMMKGYAEAGAQTDEDDESDEETVKQSVKGIASSDDDEEEAEDEEEGEEAAERRGITYQIAKNKGLTAHRKKELRNPRVKHRSKFRKALIRRKGAVRTVRTETKRYGGEISGIKATVKKGIKIKS